MEESRGEKATAAATGKIKKSQEPKGQLNLISVCVCVFCWAVLLPSFSVSFRRIFCAINKIVAVDGNRFLSTYIRIYIYIFC